MPNAKTPGHAIGNTSNWFIGSCSFFGHWSLAFGPSLRARFRCFGCSGPDSGWTSGRRPNSHHQPAGAENNHAARPNGAAGRGPSHLGASTARGGRPVQCRWTEGGNSPSRPGASNYHAAPRYGAAGHSSGFPRPGSAIAGSAREFDDVTTFDRSGIARHCASRV